MLSLGLAVCDPSEGLGVTSLVILIKGSTCVFSNLRTTNCSNIFNTNCGSLRAESLQIDMDPSSLDLQDLGVDYWLKEVGLFDIHMVLGNLVLSFSVPNPSTVEWEIGIFPNLEAVQGTFLVRASPGVHVTLLPGRGLAKLRAVGQLSFIDIGQGQAIQNVDLRFLSALECPGTDITVENLSALTSLNGLEKVTNSGTEPGCLFLFTDNPPILSDVSALAAYARCGANQRPDIDDKKPCVTVTCGAIESWSQLCQFISDGTCR